MDFDKTTLEEVLAAIPAQQEKPEVAQIDSSTPSKKSSRKSFLYGLGFGIVVMLFVATAPIVESAIPPTRAFPIIEVLTSPFAANDTNVTSTSFSDVWHIVGDGSITFNVTECYPPPCP